MINTKNVASTSTNSTKNLFIRFFNSCSKGISNFFSFCGKFIKNMIYRETPVNAEVNNITDLENTIDPLEQLTNRVDALSNDISNLNTNVANLQQEKQNNSITSDNVQNLYNDSLTNKIDTLTNNLYLFNLIDSLTTKVNDLTDKLQDINTALVNLQQEQQHIVTEKFDPIQKNIQNTSTDIKKLQQSLHILDTRVNNLQPSNSISDISSSEPSKPALGNNISKTLTIPSSTLNNDFGFNSNNKPNTPRALVDLSKNTNVIRIFGSVRPRNNQNKKLF